MRLVGSDLQVGPDLRRARLRRPTSAKPPATPWPGRTSTTTRRRRSGLTSRNSSCSSETWTVPSGNFGKTSSGRIAICTCWTRTTPCGTSTWGRSRRALQRPRRHRGLVPPRAAPHRRDHRWREAGQADQVLAPGADRVVHGRCAGCLLFVAATAPPAQSRHHQAGDLRRRDPGTSWATRRKDSRGNVKLQKLKESLFDTEVEISDDVFILKAEDAQKLLEPPRLARLVIRPEQATIKVGERAEFSVSALDQYGQPFPTPAVEWSAKGGTVTAEGVFTAGETGGVYSVHAQAAGLEAIAEVRDYHEARQRWRGGTTAVLPSRASARSRWRGTRAAAEMDELLHEGAHPLRLAAGPEAGSLLPSPPRTRPGRRQSRRDAIRAEGTGARAGCKRAMNQNANLSWPLENERRRNGGNLRDWLLELRQMLDRSALKSNRRIVFAVKLLVETREVDASIRAQVGTARILVTVECRKRWPKEDVSWIEQLATKKANIGAARTIAVSSTGFSAGAEAVARQLGIDLRQMSEVSASDINQLMRLDFVLFPHKRCSIGRVGIRKFRSLNWQIPNPDDVDFVLPTRTDLCDPIFKNTESGVEWSLNDLWLQVQAATDPFADVGSWNEAGGQDCLLSVCRKRHCGDSRWSSRFR